MAWYNPLDWFGTNDAEDKAKSYDNQDLYGEPLYQFQDKGTPYEKMTEETSHDPWKHANAFDAGGYDRRDFMYGRTPGAADEAAGLAQQTGATAQAYGQLLGVNAQNQGNKLLSEDMNRADAAQGRGALSGDWWKQNGALGGAAGYGSQLAGLEATQGPSAAQAQLQAGTNQAMDSQIALARSGRGFGANAAAAGMAQQNMAGIQANQANSAAQLRAQEDAAWRSRQASNLGNAAGIQTAIGSQYGQQSQADLSAGLQSRQQNDAAALGWAGQGQGAWQYGTGAGIDAWKSGVGLNLAGQGQASNVRGMEMSGNQAGENARLSQWAAKNGYTLAQQQRSDQQNAASMNAAATIGSAAIMASDVRNKTRIVPSSQAGSDFARGLYFDGTISRPVDDAAKQKFLGGGSSMTPMQQQYLGNGSPDRPEARPGASTNSETTQLSPEQEAAFQAWAKKNRIGDVDHPDSHYDYRGYFQQYGDRPHQQGAHFTDEFKQHGHPTFSIESNYSKGFDDGGYWEGEKFHPSARPDTSKPFDLDTMDASALDAVRNSPASFYDYKDPNAPGADAQRHYGPMAQDLAKTPAGASAVVKQPDGSLGVDTGRLALVHNGAISAQQKQLDALQAQLDAFAKKPASVQPEQVYGGRR